MTSNGKNQLGNYIEQIWGNTPYLSLPIKDRLLKTFKDWTQEAQLYDIQNSGKQINHGQYYCKIALKYNKKIHEVMASLGAKANESQFDMLDYFKADNIRESDPSNKYVIRISTRIQNKSKKLFEEEITKEEYFKLQEITWERQSHLYMERRKTQKTTYWGKEMFMDEYSVVTEEPSRRSIALKNEYYRIIYPTKEIEWRDNYLVNHPQPIPESSSLEYIIWATLGTTPFYLNSVPLKEKLKEIFKNWLAKASRDSLNNFWHNYSIQYYFNRMGYKCAIKFDLDKQYYVLQLMHKNHPYSTHYFMEEKITDDEYIELRNLIMKKWEEVKDIPYNYTDYDYDYSKKLRDPRWQEKRLEILKRDNYTCQNCSAVDKILHVHHKRYEQFKEPWEHPDELLVTLCADCHQEIHS